MHKKVYAMYYHVRIDYFDRNLKVNQTLFEYDYPNIEKVITDVTSPYIAGNVVLFEGTRINNIDIRQVKIYKTDQDIRSMNEYANASVGPRIAYVYSRPAILDAHKYSKDITREVLEKTQNYNFEMKVGKVQVEEANEKQPLLFISHASANEDIATNFVRMLRTLGFNNRNMFCSSVPGYDIREGEDIYDTLASKFNEFNIFVILLLSKEYYESPACLNEMGATWVLKANYSTIVCPGFTIPEIRGAIYPTKMAVVLEDKKRVNGKLNQLKDRLIDFFNLPEVEDDTIWENDRNTFINSI